MSRTIKFRLIYENRIIGYEEWWGGMYHYSTDDISWSNEPITMESMRKRKGQIEKDQFTGLLDKNGTPIYEGDVVIYEQSDKCVVEWYEPYAGFYFIDKTRNNMGIAKTHLKDVEVIGNIYENPELVKGEK